MPPSLRTVGIIENYAHSLGWTFGYIFGSPANRGWSWHNQALYMGSWLKAYGIVPDIYTFESWETNLDPPVTNPESVWGDRGPFMGTAHYFRAQGLFPH